MKRIFLTLVLVGSWLGTMYADNNNNNKRGNVYSASTMYVVNENVVKIKEPKQRKPLQKYNAKVGLQQEVCLNWGFAEDYDFHNFGLVNYIAGYRFNNWFYAGGGTGIYIYDSYHLDQMYFPKPKVSAEIPLYAHCKIYAMQTRLAPYFTTSLGARFGLKSQFVDIGTMFNVGCGATFRINDKQSAYLSLTYELRQIKDRKSYYTNSIDLEVCHGMGIYVGMSF